MLLCRTSSLALVLWTGAICAQATASDLDEFKIKREAVFEFASPPTVTPSGDALAIAFTTKGLCDVTVAIENAEGRIIRHLASGVLGDRAPVPFRKGTTKQTLLWDGKDEEGKDLPSGIYLCHLRLGELTSTGKLLLIR